MRAERVFEQDEHIQRIEAIIQRLQSMSKDELRELMLELGAVPVDKPTPTEGGHI
jgi:hypothetical protein